MPFMMQVWKCTRCPYRSTVKLQTQEHMRVHPRIKTFRCCLCGDTTDFRKAMHKHIQVLSCTCTMHFHTLSHTMLYL